MVLSIADNDTFLCAGIQFGLELLSVRDIGNPAERLKMADDSISNRVFSILSSVWVQRQSQSWKAVPNLGDSIHGFLP
jgi:hypothetical protein